MMREKDKDHQTPNVYLNSDGYVEDENYLKVVSTCKMQVYKFPFDIQNCNLSFRSILYNDEGITFEGQFNNSYLLKWTYEAMGTQYEWLFLNLTVNTSNHTTLAGYTQSRIVYTITMRRRSALYIANFLVPILFFFCLDLASFLISDSGGEKLSFKVTVLLAVTVMQLILNEILPSSSDRLPLMAVFCIGIFGLMMISLLETILVMYLIDRDSASEENQADKGLSKDCGDKQGKSCVNNFLSDVKKWTHCACVCNVSDEPPSELLSVGQEVRIGFLCKGNDKRSQLMEESDSLEKLPDELSEAVKALSLLLMSALFLVVIFSLWIHAKDE
ncbi:5-hydroxytryptamine receptor 3A-like [Trematomus bernacchii]|uniref:5-hydroxytryptamine receptor 3A-like n=1 Tax=Trematomus bernacchii TaxID=40690 RepID=UPI00146A9FBB|nr:5-hydroxytryptamine receptor 3A-like [Trematomus bernacchii]